jgi:N-hydroxyarylamine O-acetyltransferase
LDLDAYLHRIAYAGPRAPTLSTLHALCAAHAKAIPFENLDVLLGRGIDLADDAVDRKLVHGGRGGYCFEQNTLFLRALRALGFAVAPLSARVRVQRPRDFTPPRTHVFLRVDLDGERWLADVGVGGLSPTAALRLDVDGEQPTPHEPRRIVREGALLFHQAKLGDEWVDVCEFTLEEMPPIDREVANWFTSAHPLSHFRNRLLAARALDDGGRVTLLNRELTVRARGGAATTRRLASPDELLEALATHFALHFPAGTRFECPALDWDVP